MKNESSLVKGALSILTAVTGRLQVVAIAATARLVSESIRMRFGTECTARIRDKISAASTDSPRVTV